MIVHPIVAGGLTLIDSPSKKLHSTEVLLLMLIEKSPLQHSMRSHNYLGTG